jgi:hypothetical protein
VNIFKALSNKKNRKRGGPNNMRKILSLVLALTLVLGSFGFAFAATGTSTSFSDVNDKDVAKAVARLGAFGIVNGYEDGTYQPNKSITRAEFSKLLVVALGLDNAAQAVGTTRFADAANAWYTGYVEVAAGQGLVNGYPDGTFQPNKTVSYSEAVTMLVRALGYKDEFLPGSWPGNYIAKAAGLNVTDNVTFTPSGLADRGSVAVLLNNTLDAKVVKVDTYEGNAIKYYESDNTLLKEKLDITKLEDVRLVANQRLDDGLSSDELTFATTKKDVEFGSKTYSSAGNLIDLNFANGFDTEKFMGLEVKAYVNNDDEVIYAENTTSDRNVEMDLVDEVKDSGANVALWFDDSKDYPYDSNAKVYLDNVQQTESSGSTDMLSGLSGGDYGRVVFENGKIVFADFNNFDVLSGGLVKDVNDNEITYAKGTDKERTLKLDDYDKYMVVDKDRNTLSLSDIQEDDVIYVADTTVDGDDVAYILVVRNSKDAEIGRTQYASPIKVEVDGSYTKLGSGATISSNEDKDITASVTVSDLEDFYNSNATVIYDIKDRIRHIRGDVKSTSDELYGIVTKVATSGLEAEIKILTKDDEELVYKFEDDADGKIFEGDTTSGIAGNITAGNLIKYELTKDGTIAKNTVKVWSKSSTLSDAYAYEVSDDFGTDTVTTTTGDTSDGAGGNTYYFTKDTVVFDNTGAVSDAEVVNVDTLADKKVSASDDVTVNMIVNSDKEVKALVFVNNYTKISEDAEAAYVVKYVNTDGDVYGVLSVFDGEKDQYIQLNDKADRTTFGNERLVITKATSGNKIDLMSTDSHFSYVAGQVYNVDGTTFDINNQVYRVDSDAVVYNSSDAKSYGSINEGDAAVALVKDGKILAMEYVPAKTVVDGTVKWDATAEKYVVAGGTTMDGSYADDTEFVVDSTLSGADPYVDGTTYTTAQAAKMFFNKDKELVGIVLK